MSFLKILFSGSVLALNTLLVSLLMLPWALLKLLPFAPVRRLCNRMLAATAALWISVNDWWVRVVNGGRIEVSGIESLDPRGWYLVLCNHQSWVDIIAMQQVFNGRIPFLKFFIKHELIYVPVIGLSWWALDFPFMRRRADTVEQDLEAARAACLKFRQTPTSVMNFLEGTRFSPEVHAEQKSPYRHLLKPKGAGIGVVLDNLADKFTQVLDVTIAYPEGVPSFVDVMAGRMGRVQLHVRALPVPDTLQPREGQSLSPMAVQRWVMQLWKQKDAQLDRMLNPGTDSSNQPAA